jgi:hypothetical protein
VGKSNPTKKIYVEDYVMTYIKQLAGTDFSQCKIAVLVGQCIKLDNCRNIFISGAVEVENIDTTNEIVFSNDIWTEIYEKIKVYFVETEIVGWFIGGPGYLLEDEDKILKAHLNNFAGRDKTLLTYDTMEKEEVFINYENNRLSKQEGYYIYYEKNEEMQNYMIDHKKVQSEEVNFEDRVSKEIRTVIQNKKPVQEESKSMTRLMYAAGTLLAVIILVVGAAMLSNYDQMKNMQNTLNYLTRNMEQVQALVSDDGSVPTSADVAQEIAEENDTKTGEDSNDDGSLDVEVVSGDVKPLEEADKDKPSEDKGSKNNEKKDNKQEPVSDKELADDENDETADPGQSTSTKKEEKPVNKTQANYYIVETGDTLAGISYKLYNTYTKVDQIMDLNNIQDQDRILVGQKLLVP